jgi:membrane protein implicated in regulation of membrane protease activity
MTDRLGNGFRASANPLVQVLSVAAFGLALLGAVLIGAVVLVFLLGFAVLAGAIFALRAWWLGRKLRGAVPEPQRAPDSPPGQLIDAEYTVVEERDEAAAEQPGERRRRAGR